MERFLQILSLRTAFVQTTDRPQRARSCSAGFLLLLALRQFIRVRVAVALNDDGGGMIGHRSEEPTRLFPLPPPPLSSCLPAPPKFEFIMRVGKLGSSFHWVGRWVVTFKIFQSSSQVILLQ